MIDIYSYSDYREFIADFLYEKKKENKKNTHRELAKIAGYSSPSFFALVISGKRNLVKNSLKKMVIFLNLKKREEIYFISLVQYQQEKNVTKKLELFKEVQRRRQASSFYKLNEGEFEYFSKWYILVVKEVISFSDAGKDLKKIASYIRPNITVKEVKDSIEILKKLKIIEENEFEYTLKEKLITAANVPFDILKHIKKEYIYKSIEAMENFDSNDRYIASSTVSISENSYNKICEEIDSLRRKIMTIAENDKKCDRVVQFNFQGFMLTEVFKNREALK